MPCGSATVRPSIWKPPQIPSTAPPRRACATTASARPRSRSQARSATVDRVPGSTTTSAPDSARGLSANTTSSPGSRQSASRSVKLEMRGSTTTATRVRSTSGDGAAARSRSASASSLSSHSPGSHGSTPSTGRPVTRSSVSRPGRSSPTSPRNLFTTKPAIRRLVGGLEQRQRAVHRGEDPAAVDVADQQRRDAAVPREPHVDVVVGAQVDLGRAAGPLAHHHVEPAGQVVVRRERRLGQAPHGRRRTPPPPGVRRAGPARRRGCAGRCPA